MSHLTTVSRRHRCALPDVYGSTHGPGDVVRCEVCGTYHRATLWGAYQAPYRWKQISRRSARRLRVSTDPNSPTNGDDQ